MFDYPYSRLFDGAFPEIIDSDALACALSRMSDDELAELADELDFCGFAGLPSMRILTLLDAMDELDAGWRQLLETECAPEVPAYPDRESGAPSKALSEIPAASSPFRT